MVSSFLRAVIVACVALTTARAEPSRTLRVAAYDAAPYAARDEKGLFWGASVDLWRRVAEDRGWTYELTLVPAMDDLIAGVEQRRYDVAIGAITITPGRLARVGFSYPSHRSGVAVAAARRSGFAAILARYGAVVSHLGVLLALMLGCLLLTGVLVWLFERGGRARAVRETSIGTVFEGIYWAVVTMTTVGYGDKAPHTHSGRAIAVAWMLGSLVLISLLSTSLVAQLTVEQIDDARPVTLADLRGLRVVVAEGSSGAEFLAGTRQAFQTLPTLEAALDAVTARHADAVVNSVGALAWSVGNGYRGAVEMRTGLLAPALMGFALPPDSPLRAPLDEAMVRITTSADWVAHEDGFLNR